MIKRNSVASFQAATKTRIPASGRRATARAGADLGELDAVLPEDEAHQPSIADAIVVEVRWSFRADGTGSRCSAPFGLMDWIAIPPDTRAKTVGAFHGVGNVGVVLLFGLSWFLRTSDPLSPTTGALALSFAGFLLSLVTGWLGGELVDRPGIGVDTGANVNARVIELAAPAKEPATP